MLMLPSLDNQQSEKIARLFLTYRAYVKGIAVKYSPDAELVDDIVQQVFTIMIQKADQWTISDDPKPLLGVLTRNTANLLWRDKMKRSPETIRKIGEHLKNTLLEISEDRYEEELHALRTCLDLLPGQSRNLIDQHYFKGVSLKTISEQIGKKQATLGRALCRLRDKLRQCVERKRKEEQLHVH